MSFTVTRRRREIGIRMALGAPPGRMLASIFVARCGLDNVRPGAGCASGPGEGRRDPEPVGVGNTIRVTTAEWVRATGRGRRQLLRRRCHRSRHLPTHLTGFGLFTGGSGTGVPPRSGRRPKGRVAADPRATPVFGHHHHEFRGRTSLILPHGSGGHTGSAASGDPSGGNAGRVARPRKAVKRLQAAPGQSTAGRPPVCSTVSATSAQSIIIRITAAPPAPAGGAGRLLVENPGDAGGGGGAVSTASEVVNDLRLFLDGKPAA